MTAAWLAPPTAACVIGAAANNNPLYVGMPLRRKCPQRVKLDRLLEGRPFLLGETLSLADITAGTSLYRYFELEIERPNLPQVERWYRTVREREACRTHAMTPFGELRGRLDY